MNAILNALDLPADGPIYYGDLAPLRNWPRVSSVDFAAHHAAGCIAHFNAWHEMFHQWSEDKSNKQIIRDARTHHLVPAVNAFTIIALLNGWSSIRTCEALDSGDVAEEMAQDLLSKHFGKPEGFNELLDRLTHIPQPKVPEGQMVIQFGGAA